MDDITPSPTGYLLTAGARDNPAHTAALTLLRESGLLAREDVRWLWAIHPAWPSDPYMKANAGVLAGSLSVSSGERRVLSVALSLYGAEAVMLCDVLAGLDTRNRRLVLQAIASTVL